MLRAAAVAFALTLAAAPVARAGTSPERLCQKGIYVASAKYLSCVQKSAAKLGNDDYTLPLIKCIAKYLAVWPKLQAKATGTGSTCDGPRFVDNGDGTVTDKLTELQWEKKDNLDASQNLADPHDADNTYSWTASYSGTVADGAAFSSFLHSLNTSGSCFAGQCDWRLPGIVELLTILSAPPSAPGFPACPSNPCIDPAFGPTDTDVFCGEYWTSTTITAFPIFAWSVRFGCGSSFPIDEYKNGGIDGENTHVRAVRGGLGT
jgi:hypothetical protein